MVNPADKLHMVRATLGAVDRVVPLFDAYRQFYRLSLDLDGARRFLSRRLMQSDSTIFLAEQAGIAVGFVQLYPSFTSLSIRPWWVLNDLYVIPESRGRASPPCCWGGQRNSLGRREPAGSPSAFPAVPGRPKTFGAGFLLWADVRRVVGAIRMPRKGLARPGRLRRYVDVRGLAHAPVLQHDGSLAERGGFHELER